jgi:structural maintenance of chromosome 4
MGSDVGVQISLCEMASAVAVASPTKRLIITRMVLENFKSYAGVQNIGPFHHSFSSVVGSFGTHSRL